MKLKKVTFEMTAIPPVRKGAARTLQEIAHFAVSKAYKTGDLARLPCWCGNAKAQAHHEDYTKPNVVVFLCSLHHMERHIQLRWQRLGLKKPVSKERNFGVILPCDLITRMKIEAIRSQKWLGFIVAKALTEAFPPAQTPAAKEAKQ